MNTLADWERYIETLAPPNHVELGLERVGQVWNSLTQVAPKQVITVAGTNGKGSAVEAAGVLAKAQGLAYGQYTSPHIYAIQERVRVDGVQGFWARAGEGIRDGRVRRGFHFSHLF